MKYSEMWRKILSDKKHPFRIALCLSGQIRSFDLVKESLMKNLIGEKNIDVFCHFYHRYDNKKYLNYWNEGNEETTDYGSYKCDNITDVINLLKPVSLKFEFPLKTNNTRSMLYSIRESNRLKMDYEKLNNIKYDICIRARYDLYYNEEITFDNPEQEGVRLMNRPGGCGGVNDWFVWGNSETMDVYSEIYTEYEFNPRIDQMCPEGIFGDYLRSKNIHINMIDRTFDVLRADGKKVI